MQHFSIRKLSIGAASVLIGISFLGVKASTVKADALQNALKAELTKSKAANEAIKQDTGSNIEQEPVSDIEQEPASDIKQEPVSKTDAKQITNDQPNADQAPVKPVTPKPNSNQQNAADLEAKPQVPVKDKLQTNSAITPNKAGQSKVKATNLMAIAGKKLNANLLAESKIMTPAKDTNGGFDEATWGKLNVNDWTIETLTNADVKDTLAKSGNLELTAYNGDEQHVIIPNLLDIYNAGKADSAMVGNLANEDRTRVVISKDLLSQFSKNVASIAFSKTHTDHISNKDVTQMSDLTKTGIDHLTKVYSKDSDLSNAFSHFYKSSEWVPSDIYAVEAPRAKLDATNFDVSNVTNMTEAFAGSNYDGLSTIADWNTANATTMNGMFINANLSDLRFLSRWNTSNVTDMSRMFMNNHLLTNLVPIADWNTGNVTTMDRMFLFSPISYADLSKWDFSKIAQYVVSDGGAPGLDSFLVNYNDPSAHDNTTVYLGNNKTIPSWVLDMSNGLPNYCIFRANEDTGNYVIITSDSRLLANSNGAYNHLIFIDDTGKQTKVDIPMAISIENATGDFDSVKQRVLDFVNAEAAKQPAPTGKKWVITNTDLNDPVKIANANFKLIDISLPVLNINDAYALDSKNGLHEHANVNDNGGYDKDYWGAIDLNNWNYTQDVIGDITLSGYKGSDNTKIIIPNIADFSHGNVTQTITLHVNPNVDTNKVYISSDVMHDLARNATKIGLSKTEDKKVAASDTDWSNAFGGETKGSSSDSSYNGIEVLNPNLAIMDLHNLDTSNITDMSEMFSGGTNLKTIGDLSNWNTSNVTDMSDMFDQASMTDIGDLGQWDTSKVTDMAGMFSFASLANIGNLSKWDTSKVTNMTEMFNAAMQLTDIGDLGQWDVGNVTDMYWMFYLASVTNIGNLSKWNTSKVTDMTGTFGWTPFLTDIGDLSKWDTSNVTGMAEMFGDTGLINIGDLSKWDTSNVTNMANMFKATKFTNIGDLSKWNTAKVTDMSLMFSRASKLTNIGDLGQWDTHNVTNMRNMFDQASNLTNVGDLSNWNTDKVTDVSYMFNDNEALHNLNISNWNLSNLTNEKANKKSLEYIFADDANLTVIANNITLPAWYDNELTNSNDFWNNHMTVITNNDKLLKATGDTDTLTIDNTQSERSIFYDSKGSSDAIKVLTDANNQYIANYHKANPTKLLKLADTVDQNDPIALANASFITIPAAIGLTIHFADVDPNANNDSDTVKQELVKTVELSGNKGDAADLSQVQLPTNFELSGDLPSATFGDTDSVTIQLKHKLSDNYHREDNGDAFANTTVHAPDGTPLINGEVHMQSFIDQRQDLVTGQMVNGDTHWIYQSNSSTTSSSDILNKYIEQYDSNPDTSQSTEDWIYAFGFNQPLRIKAKAGYAVSANPELWQDSDNDGTYTWNGLRAASDWNTVQQLNNSYTDGVYIVPLDQSVHYQFMDNGTQVGSDIAVTGKTGETVATNLSIPKNYELADGTTLPTSYTFNATNPAIQINLKHKTETSVESLSATRTINVHLPNGTTKVYRQVVGYQRDVITDLVTKTVTRGKWNVNDVTSSFTIDGVKQPEHPYVLKNGNYNYASVKLPQIPGYKTIIRTATNPANPARARFVVSFMALPKPVTPALNDVKTDKTVTPATTEAAELIKTEAKAATSTPKVIDLSNDVVATAPKVIDLSDDVVTVTPKEAAWHVANEQEQDTYRVSNGKYTVELPHISNAQLHILANSSTKDSFLFTYKGQNSKYVFNIKFVNEHYLLTTYKIKSDKLVKLIDYNFVKSSKMIDVILDWINLK